MKFCNRYALLVAVPVLTATGPALANGILVEDVALSTQEPASLGANPSFESDVLVGYDPNIDVAVNLFDLRDDTGIARNLTAAHELPNRNLIISTQSSGTIGTLDYAAADLLEINRIDGTATMFLDTSEIGLVGNNNSAPNLNAVHVLDDGTILFSTAGLAGVTLDGQDFGQDDVIAYDPATQTASLFLDGSLITGGRADIHAFAVIDEDRYLLAVFDEGRSTSLPRPPKAASAMCLTNSRSAAWISRATI